MMPVLQFLGLSLPVTPLFALLAFYLGGEVSGRALTHLNRDHPDREQWLSALSTAIFLALLLGLVVARLAYAARFASLYLESPGMLLSPRIQTLATGPGVVGGALALLAYLRYRRVPLARAADALAFGLVAGGIVLYSGLFLSGDLYGTVTFVPWAVEVWGLPRHPVGLYMALALLCIGLILLWTARRGYLPGELFWRFLMFYGLSLLILGAYHANSPTWGPGIRLVQAGGLLVSLVGMFVLSYYAAAWQRAMGSRASLREAEMEYEFVSRQRAP